MGVPVKNERNDPENTVGATDDFTNLGSDQANSYFAFCYNSWEIKRRNMAFTSQSDF